MKEVTLIKTSDGKLHLTLAAARSHAEERYGDQLTILARMLVKTEGRYGDIVEFLDTRHDELSHLIHLAEDRSLVQIEDDES